MSKEAAWLLLSFAVLVVAVLVTLHKKLEGLEPRLRQLEGTLDDGGQRVSHGLRAFSMRLRAPREQDPGER